MATNVCHRKLLSLLKTQSNQLDRLYARKSRELAEALKKYKLKSDSNVWKGNVLVEKEIEKILIGLNDELKAYILKNVSTGQDMANDCQDLVVKSYTSGMDLPTEVKETLYFRDTVSLQAYSKTLGRSLDISDRVWSADVQTKEQIEYFLKSGLGDGTSAKTLATDLKQYLKNPNKRFRRVRDENGVLQLSKPAKNYNPGRGVYRSSYQNALRLARNEINIAYRQSEHIRRQQLDFVQGIRVNLSNAHVVRDICDDLQGLYPKKFKFIGWHPNCLCFTTTVLMPQEQFLTAIKNNDFSNVSKITTIPAHAQQYLNANKERISNWKSKPYFLENFKNTKDGYALKVDITR